MRTIPLINIDRLALFGNIQISTQALTLLLREGIDVAFLSKNGKLYGRLVATESRNIILRMAQYERHYDEQYNVEMARAIVQGKIKNARATIKLFQKNHPEIALAKEIEQIEAALHKLPRQTAVHSIMGTEGASTAAYFRAFGQMFRKELAFTVRTKRPPKDPVNALLSLGYTMATNEILALVIANGLDPYIGFLHGIDYGRPSLVLDIVEEFRHAVIDRLTLSLINNSIFTADDFRPVENQGVYLNDEAFNPSLPT